jgi:indole-3-acetate monooxygenase
MNTLGQLGHWLLGAARRRPPRASPESSATEPTKERTMTSTLNDATDTFVSHPGSPPTPALLDAIRDTAAAGDETADLVACHDLILDEGLFHILVPRELGGAGGTATDWFDAGLAVAGADPVAGWIMIQGAAQCAWVAVSADPSLASAVFARRQTIATSSAGQATAERIGDHYLVCNARWAYVSGCQGASYLGGMVRTTRPDGAHETRMVLVPAAEATIERSWDTHGLRGTGSHRVDLGDSLMVPATQTFTWPVLTTTRPGTLATAADHTLWMVAVSAAAVNLGAARRALEAATASAQTKLHRFDTVPVIRQPPFIRAIAELEGQVELAVAGLRRLLDDMWHQASTGEPPTLVQRARLRLSAAHAVDTGSRVVREAISLVGADALHRSHPLERLARDAEMLRNHVVVSPSTREQLGTVLLGAYEGPPGFV